MPTALFLFDYTGNAAKPWRDAGFRCVCVDIQHDPGRTEKDGIVYVGCDIRKFRPSIREDYAIVMAFPPCTHLAVSGARWFKGKGLFALSESIELFGHAAEICELLGVPYLIENPVSTISTYWRKADYSFDPCDYAGYLEDPSPEAYTKKTCLWTGGGLRDA